MFSQYISITVARTGLPWSGKIVGTIFGVIAVLGFATCYYPGPQSVCAQPLPDNGAAAVNMPAASVYLYPKAGQTPAQQDRDRYECHNWAVNQTGFDPSMVFLPPDRRIAVVPMPAPRHDTAVLGVGGALLGALIGGPRHALPGALIGGATGAIAGALSDSARQESARQAEEAYNSRYDQARTAQQEGKSQEFRRAMSACLEGRGYNVQ
ncbi:MAG: hypothetical protein CSYNP_02022 [Syntrophus sp. SKADARSKE-3]|nr:hypothetical protein [Syntrophus sp. SKADARSKE-3]